MKYFLFILLGMILTIATPAPALSQTDAVGQAKTDLLKVTAPGGPDDVVIVTGEKGEIYLIISRVINIVLGFIGLIVLIIIIVAGIEWMTSGGNADKISSAKKRMIAGVIGLAIILGAAVISNFAFNAVAISLGIEGENLDL
ncbi:MAG: hypothetical protein HN802_05800 [Candidatus Jacksonbacteria bacterium]|jgi:type IV secretory pathway VirB2 component (pilin)|nr:hypothetical protein [Candidatus Jacksonbacteria bacterium]MBT6034788.1 hypothetical protein [Candidatus Jacksonbacteria bacterium]MBT6756768.1 hypothetical protein [Candidatus Jacksonbacteria bacterium]MBT7008617.1 hypothetical protein [Candidatus Jacksonbacteria bacterium]MBT7339184.1 hypothetical protein [Candidatus Jacksonbacteria bacterium]